MVPGYHRRGILSPGSQIYKQKAQDQISIVASLYNNENIRNSHKVPNYDFITIIADAGSNAFESGRKSGVSPYRLELVFVGLREPDVSPGL